MSASKSLNISVVLDTICPWCYVGKRRIERAFKLAAEKWPEFDASVEYVPYQLDSSMGKGLDKAEVYHKKYGDRADEIHKRLTDVGKEEGISFKFGGKMSNTLDSHRIVDYARLHGQGAQAVIVESLMHRYFEQEEDIGNIQVLLNAAEDAGLDREQAKEFLESSEGVESIKQKTKQIQSLGITGVPFYIINDRYGISGAETPETFLNAFEKVFEKS
ncbi:DSBA-like thioredoxin domain-containing protein [Coemansia spiralis]|nr:DSBA-like thioredoxin domain-containing protein [Coemansia spiralis]